MLRSRAIIIALIATVVGFAGGFIVRPVIMPAWQSHTIVAASSLASEARSTHYFVSHIDEARQVAVGCRAGSVRGKECDTAEEAIIKVDAKERRKRFLGN